MLFPCKLRDFKSLFPSNHLRLGFSCLGENVFKINSCASPICECVLDSDSVKHFFLYCSRYAAQRNVLLTSAASNML